jgi:predicted nucleotidyltransferase component of viral defense system
MPDNALVDISIKTGIDADKLQRELSVMDAITPIFTLLENKGLKAGLYGGTALNKIYFQERQRLSYDLDIFCYDYTKTLKALMENGARASVAADKRGELYYKNIKLDLWSVKTTLEDPKKCEIKSILAFFGYRIPTVMCPSYNLEFLLAHKIMALSSRNLLKDIYDSWVGLQILKDKKLFLRYLDSLENEKDLDAVKAFRQMVLPSIDYYKDKQIDVPNPPKAEIMIKDIDSMLGALQGK